MSRRYRGFDPTQVPTVPVEIDWGQPGTDSVVAYWLLNNGLAIDLSGNCAPGVVGQPVYTFLQGGPRGPNQDFNGGYFDVGFPPALDFPTNAPMSIEALVTPWNLAATTPQQIFSGGYNNTTSITSYQLEFTGGGALAFGTYINSTTYQASWTYGSALANGQQFHVYADYDGANWNLWLNGALVNSTASTTGPHNTATPVTIAAVSVGGIYQQPGTLSLSNLIVRRGILTGSQVAARSGAPFAMLRPIRRRRLYSLPSRGITLSLSAGIPGFGAAASLAISDALAGAAAVPKIEGAASLAVSDALAGAAAVPEIAAAASLAVSDALVVDGEVTEIAAIIDMHAELAASMSLDANVPIFDSNLLLSLPVAGGRNIYIGPTIRGAVPANNSSNIFFSPRISSDSESYTIDFSDILLPEEKLSGPSSAVCLTNDLIIAPPILSGTSIIIPVSGEGTVGALSNIEVTINTDNMRRINLSAYVLTNPCIFHARDVRIGTIGLPSPLFSPRQNGDTDEYQLNFSAWLGDSEIIIAHAVRCLTGDLTIASASRIGQIVQWMCTGAGTQNWISSFLINIITNFRGPVSFYCGVETR